MSAAGQGRHYTFQQIKQLWIRAGGDPRLATQMAAIAMAESGGWSGARHINSNGTVDRGLWQINSSHGYGKSSFNVMRNARQAVGVYHGTQKHTGNGATAWSTYNNGAYKQYMSGGNQDVAGGNKKGHHHKQSLAQLLAGGGGSGKKKKSSGYVQPIGSNRIVHVGREDQGQDYQTKVGTKIRAIGDAVVIGVYHHVKGFGDMVVYQLTSGKYAGTNIYVGHAQALGTLHKGDHLNRGQVVATTVPHGQVSSAPDGWVEMGVANAAGTAPKYGMGGGGASTPGGAAFKQILGQASSYADKSQAKANQAAADAGNANLQAAKAQAAVAAKQARDQAHLGDPWIVVKRNGKGQIIGLGQAYGLKPPKNVLKYAGQPMTQSDLSYVWSSKYASIYEEYTGRVATPADEVKIIRLGLTPYGLQQYLSKQPGFFKSPIYKQQKGDINAEAQKILGTDADPNLIRQAIADGWDQATLDSHLRMQPGYENGPEFKGNYAQMLDVYQSIYGKPDATAIQSLQEAAAAQWSPDQLAAYLRSQPEYKTSKEYQNNVLDFLDGLGLVFGGAQAVLKPGVPSGASGGTPVQDNKYAPGAPTTLNNNLPFTAGYSFGQNVQNPPDTQPPAQTPPDTTPPPDTSPPPDTPPDQVTDVTQTPKKKKPPRQKQLPVS